MGTRMTESGPIPDGRLPGIGMQEADVLDGAEVRGLYLQVLRLLVASMQERASTVHGALSYWLARSTLECNGIKAGGRPAPAFLSWCDQRPPRLP